MPRAVRLGKNTINKEIGMKKKILLLVFSILAINTVFGALQRDLKYDQFSKLISLRKYSLAATMIDSGTVRADADPYSNGETPLFLTINTPIKMEEIDKQPYEYLIKRLLDKGAQVNTGLVSLAERKGFTTPETIDLLKGKLKGEQPVGPQPVQPTKEQIVNFIGTAGRADVAQLRALYDKNKGLLDAKDNLGMTALMNAAAARKLANVNFLLTEGANPNAQDGNKHTALIWVTRSPGEFDVSAVDIVTTLLAHHANPNIADQSGVTPIFYAVENGDEDHALAIIKVLVQEGADLGKTVLAQNGKSITVLDIARGRKKQEIINYLESLNKQPSQPADLGIVHQQLMKLQTSLQNLRAAF